MSRPVLVSAAWLLSFSLLASPLSRAQGLVIPATPLPSPAAPAAAPAPEPAAPQLQPAAPAPERLPELLPELPPTPEPVNLPAAPAPAPVPAPTPAPAPSQPAPSPPARSQSLTLRFEASLPAVVGGKKTTIPYRQTLWLPPERWALLLAQGQITPSLDADLKAFVARLSAPAQDARFEQQDDGQWIVVQHNSFKLDEAALRSQVATALKDGQMSLIQIKPISSTSPKRTLDFFVSREITAFLAAGQTNYEGSSAARITNIHVGTHAFQDRLFEGGVFSFNRMLGPVNARAGFVPGLVIAGERTASGLGGGICQVSTTVFRALYGAGLPIVERRNHSYQVYYYAPQGLDATIYQPTQDLRFANDTGGALWFQSDWDDAQKLLVVRVFGKARDYQVQIQPPRVLSTTPSPPDRILPDASLKPGQRKQIDWAAPGAVVEVDRLFVRGNQVFKRDTLKSRYRPWPNIFLVGR